MKRDLLLWLAVLVAPAVWLVSFAANFVLAQWVCSGSSKVTIYAVSLLAFVIVAGLGLIAWNRWQSFGRDWPGEAGGAAARSRFLAISGVGLSALSCVVIVAQAASAVWTGCQ